MLALPGSAYIYQGEELGLPEHTTLPDDAPPGPCLVPHRRTPRRAGTAAACRCPGRRQRPAYGFSPSGRAGCRSRPSGPRSRSTSRRAWPARRTRPTAPRSGCAATSGSAADPSPGWTASRTARASTSWPSYFSEVRAIAQRELVDAWDHAFLAWVGDRILTEFLSTIDGHRTVVFDCPPTAEHLARTAFDVLKRLTAISTATACASRGCAFRNAKLLGGRSRRERPVSGARTA